MTAKPRITAPQSGRDRNGERGPEVWAIRRALELCGLGHQRDHAEHAASGSRVLQAFARYIEQHERPPADPCTHVTGADDKVEHGLGRLPGNGFNKAFMMNRRFGLLLLGIVVCLLAAASVPELRTVVGTETRSTLCGEPLDTSLRQIDCNPTALTALVEDTIEPAPDNRMRAAVMVIRQSGHWPWAKTLTHYAIVDVDCSAAGHPDVLLIKTFDKDGTELQSAEVFDAFLGYWFTPEPAQFHIKLNAIVCQGL